MVRRARGANRHLVGDPNRAIFDGVAFDDTLKLTGWCSSPLRRPTMKFNVAWVGLICVVAFANGCSDGACEEPFYTENGERTDCGLVLDGAGWFGEATCNDGEFDTRKCYNVFTDCCRCLDASACLTQQSASQCETALTSGGSVTFRQSCEDNGTCESTCRLALEGYGS